MQYLTHLATTEVDVIPALIRHQKTKTVLVRTDAPGDQGICINRHELTLAVLNQLTVTQHGAYTASQSLPAVVITDRKLAPQSRKIHGRLDRTQGRYDEFTTGNG